MKSLHLVCNAHLDPVWLWEWPEGVAAAISTFRVAADFCETFDSFVFNHNEVILYEWIEQYDPLLFKRIQKLVRSGKWHIMGGWYLQPDCNMPAGESFVRQILLGREYFRKKFNVRPSTAINFDPFGHTRGLVQIMAKSGFDSYLFCRPSQGDCPIEEHKFIWKGYDGSSVYATRAYDFYASHLGQTRQKAQKHIEQCSADSCSILLWGVGNHGGGPSLGDLKDLNELINETTDIDISHSTPERYFNELRTQTLPIHNRDLNAWAVGCYTSQSRIKRKHRRLENEFFATEKMMTAAWAQELAPYPRALLIEAAKDLATAQFHDILPGSSIEPVQEASIRLMDHGLETLSRLKTRGFFCLAQGQKKAVSGQIPILVYNPHPYPVRQVIECEFQLADQIHEDVFVDVIATQRGRDLPSQVEKEHSNIPLEWRKRVVFEAELKPSAMSRFDCRLVRRKKRPTPRPRKAKNAYRIKTEMLDILVNTTTGFIDRFRVHGKDYLAKRAFCPMVFQDTPDPWGMTDNKFRNMVGAFKRLTKQEAALFSGIPSPTLSAVHIIEQGSVRTVVEALFGFGLSRICQRYSIPHHAGFMDIETRVLWHEKDRMLKLSIPGLDPTAECRGQVAYGTATLTADGTEKVAQQWVATLSRENNSALTVINDSTYGFDACKGELRLSLLRAPAYSAHPLGGRDVLRSDRFMARSDQGEHVFRFRVSAGDLQKRLNRVDREALVFNQQPMTLSFWPEGAGRKPEPTVILSDRTVQLTAIKKSEKGNNIVLRLFEPTGKSRSTTVRLPFASMAKRIHLGPFEIKTYRVDYRKKTWQETNLEEQPL